MTINNGTKDMMIFYDKNLNKYINEYYPSNSNNELDENIVLNYTDENNTNCFVKIEFYENGNIKNIFIPEIFSSSNMIYIDNIIKLIIPKLSPNLYIDNISNKVNEILINGSKITEEDDYENDYEDGYEDDYEENYEDDYEDDEEEISKLDEEEEENIKDYRRLDKDNYNSSEDLNFGNYKKF